MQHNELNPPLDEAVNLLQVWVMPNQQGLAPGCQKKNYSLEGKQARWRLLASPDSEKDSLVIHQDARVFATLLDGAEALDSPLATGRKARVSSKWIQAFNGEYADDSDEVIVNLAEGSNSEVLPFDLI